MDLIIGIALIVAGIFVLYKGIKKDKVETIPVESQEKDIKEYD